VARVTKNRCRDDFSIQVRLVLDRGVANRVVVNTHSVEKITMKNMRASILVAASSDSDDVFGVHAGRPSAGDLNGCRFGCAERPWHCSCWRNAHRPDSSNLLRARILRLDPWLV